MTTLKYTVVDAFTSSVFSGNPAAVILLPESSQVSDTVLLQIAAEFNLSETAFLVPNTSSSSHSSKSYGLRWLTPTMEVPICGHATLASARVLFSEPGLTPSDVTTLEFDTLSGLLKARRVPGGGGKIELEFPAATLAPVGPDEVARVAEVVCEAVGGSVTIHSVQRAGFFLLIHVDASFDLENASVNVVPFKQFEGVQDVILTSNRPVAAAPEARFISRVFGPATGVDEDPVTGSAHCLLAPYWSTVMGIPAGETIRARQVSRRGGDLELVWDQGQGTVKIRGDAVVVARGEMYLLES